jgi:hypothetical protein
MTARSTLLLAALMLGGCASPGGAPMPAPPSTASGGAPVPLPAPAPVPAPAPATAGDAGGSAQPGAARTPTERRADIDSRLDASLGGFDEELRRERERAAQERDARAAGQGTVAGDPRSLEEAERRRRTEGRDRSGDLRSAGVEPGAATPPAGESGGAAGPEVPPQGGGGAGAQRTLPDGSDDDIIARRLRRAAEQETDPELKEKLWKEYVDYKANSRGRS